MNKTLQIPVRTYDIQSTDNPDFAIVKLKAIKEGLNLNDSNFTLEGMQQCKDTFLGKPLMCSYPKNYIDNSYKIGDGHNSSNVQYDEDTDTYYYSYLDADSERCVGYIDPNQEIQIENINGENWITMNALIFKKYNFELIKDILNPNNKPDDIANNSKRVSVEVEVMDSTVKDNIEILNLWTGDGVTILGNDVPEGIKGARLTLKSYAESPKFARFKQSLSFSYKSANVDGNDKLNESSNNDIENNKEFTVAEDLGKSESIDIKNDKENAVMSDSWSAPGADFLNKLLKASNHSSLIKEAYLGVDGDSSKDLSINDVHYPHHSIKDNTLIVNAKGCQAALSRGMAQGNLTSEEKNHLKKHYKELGLNMDNFAQFELSNKEYTYLFSDNTEKEKEDIMAEKINKEENFESKDKEKDLKMADDKKPADDEKDNKETNAKSKEDKKVEESKVEDAPEKECNSKECHDDNDGDDDTNEDLSKKDKKIEEAKKEKGKEDKVEESKECNDANEDYKKKYEALESKYSELKNKYDDLNKECNAEKLAKESAITKCAETEKKYTEMKHDKFTAEANVILNKNFGLDEKDIDEISTMVKEFKFESIKDLKKEIGYRQLERKERLEEESNSLSFGLNTNVKLNNKESKSSNMIDTLDKIIKDIK